MDRPVAESLIKSLEQLEGALNQVAHAIESISDEAERKQFRRSIAEMMGDHFVKLLAPVIKQFPDMDPDKGQL